MNASYERVCQVVNAPFRETTPLSLSSPHLTLLKPVILLERNPVVLMVFVFVTVVN